MAARNFTKNPPHYPRGTKQTFSHREILGALHTQKATQEEEDPEKYKMQFAKYIEGDIDADGIEDMYTEAMEKIREDPTLKEGDEKEAITSAERCTEQANAKFNPRVLY